MPQDKNDFPDLVPDLAPPPPPPAPKAAPKPALPPVEAPSKGPMPSEPPGPIDFGGAIDLDMPGKPGAPPPPPSMRGAPPGVAPIPGPAQPPVDAKHVAEQVSGLAPAAEEAYPGANAAPKVNLDLSQQTEGPSKTNQQLQEAAKKAAVIGREVAAQAQVVAGKTRDAAMAAAIASIGGAEPRKIIRIEDPSTWLKPMLWPIVAFGLALLLTFVGVLAGVSSMRWISILLLLGAVAFAVVRWIRLQAGEDDD